MREFEVRVSLGSTGNATVRVTANNQAQAIAMVKAQYSGLNVVVFELSASVICPTTIDAAHFSIPECW